MAAAEHDEHSEPNPVTDGAEPSTAEPSYRETLCLLVAFSVIAAGLLVSTGLLGWHLALLKEGNLWSILATVLATFVPGLFFERTRKVCRAIILGGLFLTVWVFIATISGYGWYVFFTTGMSIDGAFPIPLPKSGAALLLVGFALATVCVACHNFGDAKIAPRVAFVVSVFNGLSFTLLLFVSLHYSLAHMSAESYGRQKAEKAKAAAAEIAQSVLPVTVEDVLSIGDCRRGSAPDEVICRIPTPKSDPKTNGMNHD